MAEELSAAGGIAVDFGKGPVDRAESPDFDLIFVGNDILALISEGKAFFTVRGVLKYRPVKHYVTVDMGAVPYLINGADCMGPGIVDADDDIAEGDLVWIRDVKNNAPLAIGRALRSGSELKLKKPGKAIKALTCVGDKLWKEGE